MVLYCGEKDSLAGTTGPATTPLSSGMHFHIVSCHAMLFPTSTCPLALFLVFWFYRPIFRMPPS